MSKRFLILIAITMLLCGTLQAAAARNRQVHELKKRQKVERKELRLEQRATKKVMERHPQSSEAHHRFERNLKMQRQLLRNSQKAEMRRLKGSRKPTNHATPSFRHAE